MTDRRRPLLLALSETRRFAERVADHLGVPLQDHEERSFEDGEHKTRPLVSVRGADVYVIQSLHGGPELGANDKLCRLLFFIGALRDAAAGSVTAVIPYLAYARKDRKTRPRDPVTSRYVALLIEAMGIDRVVTVEVHNVVAFQNAFRCRTEHLEARRLLAEHLAPQLRDHPVAVMSPDVGGVKRAERFRQTLGRLLAEDPPLVFMEKHRSMGVVSGQAFVGEVADRAVIIYDDLISTGGTVMRAARACREQGAGRVIAAAAHGLFTGEADELLADPALDELVISSTVPPFRLESEAVRRKLTVVDVAPLVAEAIKRIHGGGSIVELMEL